MASLSDTLGAAGWIEILCLVSALFIAYTFVLYPLAIAVASLLWPHPVRREARDLPRVTVVLAMRNEEKRAARRVENLLAQEYPEELLDVIVVSDGSTDRTAAIVQELAGRSPRVRLIALETNVGKAAALNRAVAGAAGEIVVFADARQSFARDAVRRLADAFSDPSVGSVSGELEFSDEEAGVAEPIGLYWRYEKWIRANEGLVASMLGATGAIYAIRRELWKPLPDGLLLDDFLVPMRIVLQRKRAVFDRRAIAYDQRSQSTEEEFARKVRTLAGNFEAFAQEPGLLLPWRNGSTWFQVWSHKVFRLLAPYFLVLLFVCSGLSDRPLLFGAFVAQAVFYGLALVGLVIERTGRHVTLRLVYFPLMFVTFQAAAVAGLWVWLTHDDLRSVWRRGPESTGAA